MTRGSSTGRPDQASTLVPSSGPAVVLTSYQDALEAFRHPQLWLTILDGSEQYRGGAVSRINGEAHRVRRRVLSRLLKREGDEWFRQTALYPTLRRNLQRVLENPDPDGLCRVDLVPFMRLVHLQMTGTLLGLLGIETEETAAQVAAMFSNVALALSSAYTVGDREGILARGLAAKQAYYDELFKPSLLHHAKLLQKVESGEMGEDELPHNVMMLMAAHVDPTWIDTEMAMRETMMLFNAGGDTIAMTVVHGVNELLDWLETHPEDQSRRGDPEFLLAAVNETLRLHPIAPAMYRVAQEDITLRSGTRIKAGQVVELSLSANLDPTVWGEDAARFNPRRRVPDGVYSFGLAFGSGAHMCFGLPLVMGTEGMNGGHVQLFRAMLALGVERDPERPPIRSNDTTRDSWNTYPVFFSSRVMPVIG
jgi:cytochrome P450